MRSRQYPMLLLLFLSALLSQNVLAQQNLESKIRLADEVDAVDPRVSVGSTFDKQYITSVLGGESSVLDYKNGWFQIPAWFAGSWTSTNTSSTYRRNEITGVVDNEARLYNTKNGGEWGHMRDSFGNVWHVYGHKFWSISKSADYDRYSFKSNIEPVYVTEKAVILKAGGVDIKVDKANKVISVTPFQQISQYKPVRDGVIRAKKLFRAYDPGGKAAFSTSELEVYQRSKPFIEFRPDNKLDVEMKSHLDKFLRAQEKKL
ncbi:MAG: hypothetical protein K2X77_11300 [Candidatus Obscuribacterales bacterium]|nr:hypothetical protein [Candidatus Obscuribacterales bacterium]